MPHFLSGVTVDSISLKTLSSEAYLTLCDAAKCFNLARELYFLTVQSGCPLSTEYRWRIQWTPLSQAQASGERNIKKKCNSSRIVLFFFFLQWMNDALRECAVSWTKGCKDEWRGESFFSFFLMYFVLLLSSGPLSIQLKLPGVEFIKRQSCQLSQKSPHHSAVRGEPKRKSMT